MPRSTSEQARPLIEAGFHIKAPAASMGAAVAAPPIERLTGPTPLSAMPWP